MSGATRFAASALAAAMLAAPGAAWAEPLYSYWTLQPIGPLGDMDAAADKPFLEQRLLPARLVRLTETATISKGKSVAAGTFLFAVFQKDGQIAFCTTKDQSGGNVAKSLFIPMFDKRPCLVDRDRDGAFDAAFSVFDKYGSALTPSGNLSSAKPLAAPARYDAAAPEDFPAVRRLAYTIAFPNDDKKRQIAVKFDNGGGYAPWQNVSPDSTPAAPTALNVRAEVRAVTADSARIHVGANAELGLLGSSSGGFAVMPLPDALRSAVAP